MSVAFAASTAGSVAVDAAAADREWLASFLTPGLNVVRRPSEVTARVHLAATAAESAQVRTGSERVAFVLDRKPVRLPEAAASNALVYVDAELQVSYAVRAHGRDVTVHHGLREDLTRMAVMRVVREYAHNTLLDDGGLVIHAAAFAGPRGAVLLTGPKGVGKTTLLARMLSRAGVSYLANDRVGIMPDAWKALAISTIVAVRSGTRRLLPELGKRLRGLGRFTALPQSGGDPPDRMGDPWYFSPRQFAESLSCELVGHARLAAVVALRPEAPPGALRQASPAEAVDLLGDALLGAQAGVFVSEIFRTAPAGPGIAERLRGGCRLAREVPCFTLSAPASLDDATLDGLQSLCEQSPPARECWRCWHVKG